MSLENFFKIGGWYKNRGYTFYLPLQVVSVTKLRPPTAYNAGFTELRYKYYNDSEIYCWNIDDADEKEIMEDYEELSDEEMMIEVINRSG